MSAVFKLFSNFKFVVILVVLFAVMASIQAIADSNDESPNGGKRYTEYNNYLIFKQSYFHLIENKDLYKEYPNEYWDLYKYSPTFSLFFSIFAYLPDFIGLILWNLLNATILLFAIYLLPKIDIRKRAFILLVILLELLTSMQNEQSNGLITGLTVMSFVLLERKYFFFAGFCIVFSVYIKLFGIAAIALFLLYPQKGKLAIYTVFWFAILFLLPLIVIRVEHYQFIYTSWGNLLENDHTTSYGYSIMGCLQACFGLTIHKLLIVLFGTILFFVPFVRTKLYDQLNYKLLILSSILIWIVIFNHKAESPTFIIAMTGAAIWFFISEKSKINIFLFILAFVFTTLSSTDVFPKFIRTEWFEPYAIKAIPCILIWFKIIYDLMKMKLLTQNKTQSIPQ